MSSAIGIGLSAEYSGSKEAIYEWSADYGGFMLWAPEISLCNSPCITDKTVWWTYMTGDEIPGGSLPEEVRVTLKAIDPESGDIMAESTITLTKTDDGGYRTGD